MTEVPGDGGWRHSLGQALQCDRPIDLVGVGNLLRGDDAVGIEVASRLRSRLGRSQKRFKVHPASQTPEMVLSKLAATAARVVVFDAVEASSPPGTIVCSSLGDTKYGFFATHNVPLKLVPGVGSRLDDFYVVGVQPLSLEVTEGLSEAAGRAADAIVDFIAATAEGRT